MSDMLLIKQNPFEANGEQSIWKGDALIAVGLLFQAILHQKLWMILLLLRELIVEYIVGTLWLVKIAYDIVLHEVSFRKVVRVEYTMRFGLTLEKWLRTQSNHHLIFRVSRNEIKSI